MLLNLAFTIKLRVVCSVITYYYFVHIIKKSSRRKSIFIMAYVVWLLFLFSPLLLLWCYITPLLLLLFFFFFVSMLPLPCLHLSCPSSFYVRAHCVGVCLQRTILWKLMGGVTDFVVFVALLFCTTLHANCIYVRRAQVLQNIGLKKSAAAKPNHKKKKDRKHENPIIPHSLTTSFGRKS